MVKNEQSVASKGSKGDEKREMNVSEMNVLATHCEATEGCIRSSIEGTKEQAVEQEEGLEILDPATKKSLKEIEEGIQRTEDSLKGISAGLDEMEKEIELLMKYVQEREGGKNNVKRQRVESSCSSSGINRAKEYWVISDDFSYGRPRKIARLVTPPCKNKNSRQR